MVESAVRVGSIDAELCTWRNLGYREPAIGYTQIYNPAEGFPGDSAGKESTCNAGDLGLIPGLGRSPGEGNGYPLQYSGLENPMDHTVHGVANSWTQPSHFHTCHRVL